MPRKKREGRWVHNVKIFTIEYLKTAELTEDDLAKIFETPSLVYSMVIGMFNFIGSKKSDLAIINMAKKDERWMYKNFWTREQHDAYTEELVQVMKNVYQVKDVIARSKAEWQVFEFGLTIREENDRKGK